MVSRVKIKCSVVASRSSGGANERLKVALLSSPVMTMRQEISANNSVAMERLTDSPVVAERGGESRWSSRRHLVRSGASFQCCRLNNLGLISMLIGVFLASSLLSPVNGEYGVEEDGLPVVFPPYCLTTCDRWASGGVSIPKVQRQSFVIDTRGRDEMKEVYHQERGRRPSLLFIDRNG